MLNNLFSFSSSEIFVTLMTILSLLAIFRYFNIYEKKNCKENFKNWIYWKI